MKTTRCVTRTACRRWRTKQPAVFPWTSKSTWCLTSTETIRLIRDGEKGVWRWGRGRLYIYQSLHSHSEHRFPAPSSKLCQILLGREKLLKVPKTNLKSAGNRSFHFQAAKIWNSILTNVRSSPSLSSLKKNMKTSF